MKKSIVCMLIMCMMLCLSACGIDKTTEPTATTAPTATPTSTPTPKPTQPAPTQAEPTPTESANAENIHVPNVEEEWNPEIIQRQIIFDEGAMCGVIFLGYVEASAGTLESNREYYQTIFEETGYLDGFPFLAEIPNSNFVETEWGQELYCIIPLDCRRNEWIRGKNRRGVISVRKRNTDFIEM